MWLELAILARPYEACSPAPMIGAGIFYEVQHFVTRMQISMHGSFGCRAAIDGGVRCRVNDY
jgi:hypothetical protein